MRAWSAATVLGVVVFVGACSGDDAGPVDVAATASSTTTIGVASSAPVDEPGAQEGVPPAWFSDRDPLPSCGGEEEYTDSYPNDDARACFRDSYDSGAPGEFEYLSYGDEGESALTVYRVLGSGSFEAYVEFGPDPAGLSGNAFEWQRHDCNSFFLLDDPGTELDGAPSLGHSDCELARSSAQ